MSFSDPVFRFSDTPRIRSMIDQFEADPIYDSRAPEKRQVTRRFDCSGNAVEDIIRRLGAVTASVNEKEVVLKREVSKNYRFSTYEDSDSDSDYSEEINRIECRFQDAKYNRVFRVCGTVVGGLAGGLLRLVVDCLPPVSFASLAVICTLIVACAPRMLTDLVIYPCCRLVFGTLYPAYASYKAVRTKNVKEYVKWMMYWIVFALFTCAETVTDVFFSWFPFYYEVKIILVLWLLSPATKGSSILYRKFVHPALCRREQEIDEYISKAKDQGYHTVLNLGTKGVNYATNVIMQTAIKNFSTQSTVDAPTPSARQPISSVADRREGQFMEQILYRSACGDENNTLSMDEVDLTHLDDDVVMQRDTIADIVYNFDKSIPAVGTSPVRLRRKTKTEAVPKRSRSNSRKTRRQTASTKVSKTKVKRDLSAE